MRSTKHLLLDNLSLHIEYLLRHHDCVILPGIGAFLNHRINSHIDKDSGLISPPSREVSFNASISSNDGLLAHSISRKERINFEEARERLNLFSQQLLRDIREEGEASVGNIGSLRINEEGHLIFSRNHSASSFAHLLGFTPVAVPSRKNDKLIFTTESTENRPGFSKKYYYFRIRKSIVHSAAVFACLIALGLGMLIPFSSDNRPKEYASVVPIAKVTEVIAPATPAPAKVSEEKPESEPDFEIVPEKDCSGSFYGIIGTFRSLDEVKAFLKQTGTSGRDIKIIAGKKLYKICAADGKSAKEVALAMNSEELSSRYSQYWIWKAP